MRCQLQSMRRDEGFSLIELLVVMVVLGIVSAIVGSAILSGINAQQRVTNRLDALHELEVAVQRSSRDLRAASPLVLSETEPASQSAGVRFQRDGRDWLVLYEVLDADDGATKELVQSTLVDGVLTERALVTRVDNEVEDEDGNVELIPVFSYFRRDGSEIDCDNTAGGTEGQNCRAELLLTASIGIDLVREVVDAGPVQVSTTVSVRSVRYRGGS